MKKFFFILTVVFASISVFAQTANIKNALTSSPGTDLLTEAKSAIAKGNARWIESFEKGDPAMAADLFTSDGVMLSSSGKVFKGRQQILDHQKAIMDAVGKEVKVTADTTTVWVDGETAYETGKYSYTYQENGKQTVDKGKYVTIWKRQKDGSWKLAMDMGVPQD